MISIHILCPLTLFLLNLLLKLYKIENGNYVVWDEAHFGKYACSYLKRQFFFDVHPPLGKLMTAFFAYMANQNPNFEYESGHEYSSDVDYAQIRRYHALVSALIPVLIYGTFRNFNFSKKSAFFSTFFLILENGNISISRLILLDSHLLLFTSFVIFFFSKWAFNKNITNILGLGFFIGMTLSVKWIGCFTTSFVGLFIIGELYYTLKYRKIKEFLIRFLIRFIFLILVPALIYIFWFVIHYKILIHSSGDEGQMSSLFQLNLVEFKDKKIGKYIEFGTITTLKASELSKGNLHSHNSNYPNSQYQQITIYHHKDENDDWIIQKVIQNLEDKKTEFLKNNDKILILHNKTKKYLCIHGTSLLSAPNLLAVGVDEANLSCIFQVQFKNDILKNEKYFKTMTTKFSLFNVQEKCYLQPTNKNYPSYGFNQGEVVCSNKSFLWNFEKNENFSDKNVQYKEIFELKFQFYNYLIELNKQMLKVNRSFEQDKELEPLRIVSKPYEWFILKRGLRMVDWSNSERYKFYMFGNPIVWILSSFSILISLFLYLKNRKIRYKDYVKFYVCFYGWFIHYVPFFFISRVLYFHHYFPALLFAILSIGFLLRKKKRIFYFLIGLSTLGYLLYSPLTYGFKEPGLMKYTRLIGTWDYL